MDIVLVCILIIAFQFIWGPVWGLIGLSIILIGFSAYAGIKERGLKKEKEMFRHLLLHDTRVSKEKNDDWRSV